MNLPFTPDGKMAYASTKLVDGITNAGYSTTDVQVVHLHEDGYWLVVFKSDPNSRFIVMQ